LTKLRFQVLNSYKIHVKENNCDVTEISPVATCPAQNCRCCRLVSCDLTFDVVLQSTASAIGWRVCHVTDAFIASWSPV